MIHRVLFCGTLCAFVLLLLGCGPTSTAPVAQTEPAGATGVARRTPLPLPPQPTSPPIPPRTPTPWQSPVPAPFVFGPTLPSSPGGIAPILPLPTTAVVGAQPAPTTAGAVPSAPGVATGRRSEAKFVFLTPLTMREEAEPLEMEPMRAELKKLPGFLDMTGDENTVTVGYDAGLVTVAQLIQRFAELKHPVKQP